MSQDNKVITGLHVLGEVYAKDSSHLNNILLVKDEIVAAIEKCSLTQVGFAEHVFPEGGFTFVVLLAESHLSVHTWPELNYVTLDVFVCNMSKDNSASARELFDLVAKLFNPLEVVKREVIR